MVLLVVGGGVQSLLQTHLILKKRRPVVVLADTGGAAAAMHAYVVEGTPIEELEPNLIETARAYLPHIKELGSTDDSEGNRLLSFYKTSLDIDENSSLSNQILSAILSDCENTAEKINHAVRWRNAAVIRTQLDKSSETDPHGIAKAFQGALKGRDRSVIKTLIKYNIKVEYVSLESLVPSGRGETPYTWGEDCRWQTFRGTNSPAMRPGEASAVVEPEEFDGAEMDEVRFTRREDQPIPAVILEWLRKDTKSRSIERKDGTKPGEWMQDEIDHPR